MPYRNLGAGAVQILIGGMPGSSYSVLVDALWSFGVNYHLPHRSLLLEFFSFQHIFRFDEFEEFEFIVF